MTRTALNRGFVPYILLYLWQSWRKSFVIPRTSLYRGSASVHTKQDKISIISYRMISNASTELEQLVHTHRTSYQSCWPRGLGELNPIPISRIFFSVSVDSSPRSHLFTPVILPWQSEHLSVHTAPKWWHWIYLICDVPLSRSVLRSSIRAVITALMCEQRPYPEWFSRLRKSYPIWCENSLS